MNNLNPTTTTPNFDNLLLQSLMSRLQLRHQPPPSTTDHHHPLLSQSFEDLLFDAATNASFSFSDEDDDDDDVDFNFNDLKTNLSKEESKLEKELIKVILAGKTEALKPNSGQAVAIGDHHVCVGFHEESGSDYRVWEWHGHIMLFDEENGYTPEYIYGNYFERLTTAKARREKKVKEEEEVEEEKGEGLGGLKELIDGVEAVEKRVLHQSRNAGSPRCLKDTSGTEVAKN